MSPRLGRRPTPGGKARQGVLTSSGKILLCAMGLPMGMFLVQACTIIVVLGSVVPSEVEDNAAPPLSTGARSLICVGI